MKIKNLIERLQEYQKVLGNIDVRQTFYLHQHKQEEVFHHSVDMSVIEDDGQKIVEFAILMDHSEVQ